MSAASDVPLPLVPKTGLVDEDGKAAYAKIRGEQPKPLTEKGVERQKKASELAGEYHEGSQAGVYEKPFMGAQPKFLRQPQVLSTEEQGKRTNIACQKLHECIYASSDVLVVLGSDVQNNAAFKTLLHEAVESPSGHIRTTVALGDSWMQTLPRVDKAPQLWKEKLSSSLLVYIGTPGKYLHMCTRSTLTKEFDVAFADNRLVVICPGSIMLPIGTQVQSLYGVDSKQIINFVADLIYTEGPPIWGHGTGTKQSLLSWTYPAKTPVTATPSPRPIEFGLDTGDDGAFDFFVPYVKYLNEAKFANPAMPIVNYYDTGMTVSIAMGTIAEQGVSLLTDHDGLAMLRDASIGHTMSKMNQLFNVEPQRSTKSVYNFFIGDGASRLNGGAELTMHMMQNYVAKPLVNIFLFHNEVWAIEDNLVAHAIENHKLRNRDFYNLLRAHPNVVVCDNTLELRATLEFLSFATHKYLNGTGPSAVRYVIVRGLEVDVPPCLGSLDPILASADMAFMRKTLGKFAEGCQHKVPIYGCSAFEYIQFLNLFLEKMPEGQKYQYICGRTDIQAEHMCGFRQIEGKCVLFINDVYGINSIGESLRAITSGFGNDQVLIMIWHPTLVKVVDNFHLHRPPLVWPSLGPELCKYYARSEQDMFVYEFEGQETTKVTDAIARGTPIVVVNMLPEQERNSIGLDIHMKLVNHAPEPSAVQASIPATKHTVTNVSRPGQVFVPPRRPFAQKVSASLGAPFIPAVMKAAVVEQCGQPLVVKEVPVPEPGHGEVLIRVVCSGVCHTDLHVRDGDWYVKPKLPIIPGHEGAGIVVKCGTGVNNINVGDRVGHAWLHDSCGGCDFCLEGWETVCKNQHQTGFVANGCFAEYTVADARYVGRIPDTLTFSQAAPILCAGVTTYKALKETEVKPGQWVAIIGACGGLGHVACQYARAMGMKVVAIDFGPEKEKYATESLGCDRYVDIKGKSGDQVVGAVKAASDGDGVHGSVVLAPVRAAFRQGVDMLRPLGTTVGIALPPGEFPVDIFSMILERKTVRGSIVGTRKDLNESLCIAGDGKVICTVEERKLDDINEVLQDLASGKIRGRVVLRLVDEI